MVYPGVVYASVHLDPGDGTCSSTSTSCTATITSEGVYNVSLTLKNDVGPSQPEVDMFNCEQILCAYTYNYVAAGLHVCALQYIQVYITSFYATCIYLQG